MRQLFNLVSSVSVSPIKLLTPLLLITAGLQKGARAESGSDFALACACTPQGGYSWQGCESSASIDYCINVYGPVCMNETAVPKESVEKNCTTTCGDCCDSNGATPSGYTSDCSSGADSSSSGLSLGAIAGIAAGGVVAVAACCGISLWAKKRRDGRAEQQEHLLDAVVNDGKEEKDQPKRHAQHIDNSTNIYCTVS